MIEMTPLPVHSRTVRVTNADGELPSTVIALADGTFCVYCKPGLYQFSVGKLPVLLLWFYCICHLCIVLSVLMDSSNHSAACIHTIASQLRQSLSGLELSRLESWSGDILRPCFQSLGLGLVPQGPSLGLGLEVQGPGLGLGLETQSCS